DDRFAIQIGGEIEQVRFDQQLPRPESGADPDVDRGRVTLPVPSDIAGVDPDSRCHLPVREGDVGSGDPQFTTPPVTVFDDTGQMEQVTERISGTPGVSIFDHQSDRAGEIALPPSFSTRGAGSTTNPCSRPRSASR